MEEHFLRVKQRTDSVCQNISFFYFCSFKIIIENWVDVRVKKHHINGKEYYVICCVIFIFQPIFCGVNKSVCLIQLRPFSCQYPSGVD